VDDDSEAGGGGLVQMGCFKQLFFPNRSFDALVTFATHVLRYVIDYRPIFRKHCLRFSLYLLLYLALSPSLEPTENLRMPYFLGHRETQATETCGGNVGRRLSPA
jgi:hypothetical protein